VAGLNADILLNSGSPTWARTRDLRINSTDHTDFYGVKVEDV